MDANLYGLREKTVNKTTKGRKGVFLQKGVVFVYLSVAGESAEMMTVF